MVEIHFNVNEIETFLGAPVSLMKICLGSIARGPK